MASTSNPQGLLVTAGKVHVPFKSELLSAMSTERFAKRPPHLVGLLATKKEDARTYAEVSLGIAYIMVVCVVLTNTVYKKSLRADWDQL